jgi:predicted membrane protein
MPKSITIGFTSGAIGGIANVLFLSIIALLGLQSFVDPGNLTTFKAFLYKQMVWGGLWGIIMAIVYMPKNWILRGIIFGLITAAVVLFYLLPSKGLGIAGLEKGINIPFLVLGADLTWGIVTSFLVSYFYSKI